MGISRFHGSLTTAQCSFFQTNDHNLEMQVGDFLSWSNFQNKLGSTGPSLRTSSSIILSKFLICKILNEFYCQIKRTSHCIIYTLLRNSQIYKISSQCNYTYGQSECMLPHICYMFCTKGTRVFLKSSPQPMVQPAAQL